MCMCLGTKPPQLKLQAQTRLCIELPTSVAAGCPTAQSPHRNEAALWPRQGSWGLCWGLCAAPPVSGTSTRVMPSLLCRRASCRSASCRGFCTNAPTTSPQPNHSPWSHAHAATEAPTRRPAEGQGQRLRLPPAAHPTPICPAVDECCRAASAVWHRSYGGKQQGRAAGCRAAAAVGHAELAAFHETERQKQPALPQGLQPGWKSHRQVCLSPCVERRLCGAARQWLACSRDSTGRVAVKLAHIQPSRTCLPSASAAGAAPF